MTSNHQLYLFSANSNISHTYVIPSQRASCWHRVCPIDWQLRWRNHSISLDRRLRRLLEKEKKDPLCKQHKAVQGPERWSKPGFLPGWDEGQAERRRKGDTSIVYHRIEIPARRDREAEAWKDVMTFLLPHVFTSNWSLRNVSINIFHEQKVKSIPNLPVKHAQNTSIWTRHISRGKNISLTWKSRQHTA